MFDKKTILGLMLAATVGAGVCPMAAKAVETDGWNGFYVGAGAGLQMDHSSWTGTSVGPNNVFGVDPSTAKAGLNDPHGRLGGFVGWSMPATPDILLGVEADMYGMIGSSTTETGLPGITYGGLTSTDTLKETQHYDASLRGRVATQVESNAMIYGTAGVAFRDYGLTGTCPGNNASWCGVPESGSLSKTAVGWTVGAGGEAKVAPAWTVRLEYRYADYGRTNISFFGGNNQGIDAVGGKVDLASHLITLGFAYHLGM